MVESFKTKSRIITLLVAIVISIASYVATMSPGTLATYLPQEYQGFAVIIIIIAATIVNQYSEEKRVTVAEDLILEKQNNAEEIVMNDEYITDAEEEQ